MGGARVSTIYQNLDRLLGALRAAGCEFVLAEKATGTDVKSRPDFERAIDALGHGNL